MTAIGSAAARVLLVEGDPSTIQLMRQLLHWARCDVEVAATRDEVHRCLGTDTPPDAVILDVMLPDVDGMVLLADVCDRYDVPVIVCSQLEQRDTLLAFRLGADDVISKPFDPDEFGARVRAALRRHPPRRTEPHRHSPPHPGFTLDHLLHTVRHGATEISLTPTEYRLFRVLLESAGEPLSRHFLVARVWGSGSVSASRTLDIHIRRLREKLARFGAHAPMILAVRGTGYRLLDASRRIAAPQPAPQTLRRA